MPPFSKVLVANRGEIAVRVFRTLRELGIGCVAVYSDADRGALHVAVADEAYLIGPGPAAESYLRGDRIVEVARGRGGGDPPGVRLPRRERRRSRGWSRTPGSSWIGPPPDAIELMGSKTAARARMRAAGVPIVPGTTDPVASARRGRSRSARRSATRSIVKAPAGGGGKGMESCAAPDDAERAFERRDARARSTSPTPTVVRRAVPRGPPPRRGAGPRRRARERRPPRGARLHDPAAPPEARRGDALARGRRRSCARGSARSPSTRRVRPATARRGRSKGLLDARRRRTTSWR